MLKILFHFCGKRAKPATKTWNLTKTYLQTIIFWTILLFLLPFFLYQLEENIGGAVFRFKSSLFSLLGGVLFCISSALALWSCYTLAVKGEGTPVPFDCPSKLVAEGPYRYVRNPMAISGIAQGIGVGLYLGSPLILCYVTMGLLLAEFIIHPWEEMDIERRFGAEYRKYRESVPRWFFFFRLKGKKK